MSYQGPVMSGQAPSRILTPASPNFSVSRHLLRTGTSIAGNSYAWEAANCPVALKFWLNRPETVYQLGWENGSGTMTDSCDVGIYDTGWARKISTTSTARSGVSSLQFVDVADTALTAGGYWLVMSNTGTTANQQQGSTFYANATMSALAGVYDSATTAEPLPDPLTNMAAAATFTHIPMLVIALRSSPI